MGSIIRMVVLVLAGVGVTGCACPDAYPIFEEGFEYCAGTCDWTVVGDGEALRVATVHPGEHGMRLNGSVWLDRPAALTIDFAQAAYTYGGPVTVEVITNCADGVSAGLAVSDQGGYQLLVILPPGGARPPEDGYQLVIEPLAGPSVVSGAEPVVVDTVTVVNQSGYCVIDGVRVVMPAPPCMG